MSSSSVTRTRFFRRGPLTLGGALGTLLFASAAGAQIDVAPPLPNVLLLVDTSGSMEFKADGNPVQCNPANTALTNDKSRWVNVLEVLTGTFNGYSCQSVDRASDNYKTSEYKLLSSSPPYDFRYTIPYHRPLSGGATGCVAAPGTLPGTAPNASNPFIYPADPLHYHVYSSTYSSAGASCTQSQTNDGILDAFGTRVRFGLMTFDTETNAGLGYSGSAADTPTGHAGLYSYVVNPAVTGKPMGCATPAEPQEVGARNGSAPVWEGRMINFGNPNDAEKAYEAQAQRIQQVLVGTRPFGATPIAGMLHDAEDFFWKDAMVDPGVVPTSAPSPYNEYGPKNDPYLGCDTPRQQIIILLTDGEPNMDLRPQCSDTPVGGLAAGACPFDLPETITNRLANPSSPRKPIKTYVVGFGLELVDADLNSATAPVSCTLVTTTQCAAPGVANNIPLQACCNLQRIAIAGGGQAFFASNADQLRSAISDILRRSVPTTSRTQPATSGGGSGGGAFRFFSGFEVGQLAPWNAQLTRERWTCVAPSAGAAKVPTKQAFAAASGDDFVENVNSDAPLTKRLFYTAVGKAGSTVMSGIETVRRGISSTDPDGAGTLLPNFHSSGMAAATYAGDVPPEALAIPAASYPTGITTPAAASLFFLKWLVGANATSDKYHRCPNSSNCELVGDIYHSTPQVMGAPSERLQDESYQRFATEQAKRPIVLYTSTNDGFLHAFKVATNDPTVDDTPAKQVLTKNNNELWAFAPPAVLPSLYALYPYNHMHLLDGVATIADVVATVPLTPTDPPTLFERSANDARAGAGTWRTVLVQSFGLGRGGYFAVDVTNPVPNSSAPSDPDKGGPRFLWQLTRDATGNELFGRSGANPGITTLFFDPTGGTNPREIPVAILPGGRGGTRRASATGCPEAPDPARTFPGVSLDSRFTPRGRVNCYDWGSGNSEIGARSLTIVRLDTGEIIRTFRQKQTEVASAKLRTLTTEVEIDSPITGQPVAFPGLAGAVADRIIVGDQDGRLWKVNVASPNPALWTMKLFFDLYPLSISSAGTHDFDDGQPVATPPILSVDESGNMTVNVTTGDQDALGYSTDQTNYVYSITEDFGLARATATNKVNWLKAFATGERSLGPLVLFNSNLYFVTFAGNNPSDSSKACKPGASTLWGMNYIQPNNPSDFKQGGLAALPNPPPATPPFVQSFTPTDKLIFGVTLAQQPTCFTRADDATGNDLFGYRGQTTVTQVTPAKFELVMQTSPTSSTPGQAPEQSTVPLPQPTSFARVLSWASIIE